MAVIEVMFTFTPQSLIHHRHTFIYCRRRILVIVTPAKYTHCLFFKLASQGFFLLHGGKMELVVFCFFFRWMYMFSKTKFRKLH